MESEDSCPICLNKRNDPVKPKSCIHVFCRDCLERWNREHDTCPLCRQVYQYVECGFNEDSGEYEILKKVEKKRMTPRRNIHVNMELFRRTFNALRRQHMIQNQTPVRRNPRTMSLQPPTSWEMRPSLNGYPWRRIRNRRSENGQREQIRVTIELD